MLSIEKYCDTNQQESKLLTLAGGSDADFLAFLLSPPNLDSSSEKSMASSNGLFITAVLFFLGGPEAWS